MSEAARDQQLEAILHDYLQAVDAGQRPDGDELLRRHPDFAAELREFLSVQANVDRVARALDEVTVGPGEGASDLPRVRYFGDYELLAEIARGGMGVVYKARQVSLDRIVALKMILAGRLASAADVQRFHTEAQAAANLDHPNIVPIYEVGEHEGQHFFSMRFVDGTSLAGKLAGASWRAGQTSQAWQREAAILMAAVARAVHHAHQRGILHRDLKPANILLQRKSADSADYTDKKEGTSLPVKSAESAKSADEFIPKITDFGLAKQMEKDTGQTASGAILGTPSYMAPEQARSDKVLTTAVDVYSLGAILYEMLTGRPPFRGADLMQTLQMVLEAEPQSPSRVHPDGKIDRDLETICLKCLSKEPGRRYGSAEALADDLERWLAGKPIAARPARSAERAWRWCRRNPVIAGLSAAVACLLLALAIGGPIAGFHFNVLAERERQAADNERRARKDAEEARGRESRERKRAEDARDAKDRALRRAESLRLAAQSSNVLAHDPGLALLLAVAGAERSPERPLDANNALLTALQECREVRTVAAAPVAPHANLKTHVSFTSLAVSPDGKRLATVSDRHLWNGARNEHLADRELFEQRAVQLRDAHTGAVQATIHIPGMMVQSVHFSPNGKVLATIADGGTTLQGSDDSKGGKKNEDTLIELTDWVVRLWDTTTGRELNVLRGHQHRVTTLDFSPDSRLLATGSFDHTVRIFDVATGKTLHVLEPEKRYGKYGCAVARVRFSPDGQRLLTLTNAVITSWENRPPLWPRDPPARRIFKNVKLAHSFPFGWIGHGPDRQEDRDASPAQLWDPASGKLLATLRPESKQALEETTWAGFTHDGKEVVTGHWRGSINRWRAGDGTHLARVQGERREITHVEISTDGARMLVHYSPQSEAKTPAGFALYELAGGKVLGRWDEQEPPSLVRLGGDGRLLLTVTPGAAREVASRGRTASLRSAETGKVVTELRGHWETITAAEFLLGGQVITVSLDGTMRAWPTVSLPGSVRVLPGRANAHRRARYQPHGNQIVTIATPAGRRKWPGLVPETWERFAELWDGAGQRAVVLQALSGVDGTVRDLVLGGILDAQFSPDGQALVMVGEDWLPTNDPPGHARQRYAPVRVWDTRTGKERYALEGFSLGVLQASFSPDGRYLLTVGDGFSSQITFDKLPNGTVRKGGFQVGMALAANKEPAVRVWDAATGKLVRVLLDHGHECSGAAWSPDGKRVVTVATPASHVITVDYPVLALWDVATGKLVGRLERITLRPGQVQFSPDGKYVLGLDGAGVILWDAASGKHVRTLAGHGGDVTAAAFSPDGSFLASAANDRLAILWDVATGKERHRLAGHAGRVLAVAVSGDGRWIATAGEDGTARLWASATGREWLTLTGHRGPVEVVSFRADGQALLTGGADGTAREWPVEPLPAAKRRLPRRLTREERGRFQVPESH
jgi:WD40 repeat protein/serine/threonine protein kinase